MIKNIQDIERIAVWQTAFLGDAILTLPLVQSLAESFPDAKIDFYVRSGLKDLFSPHPALHRVHEFSKRGRARGVRGLFSMVSLLSDQQYDLLLAPHASIRSGIIARLSRIPMRIGYDIPRLNRWFHTHRISRRFSELEEIERILQLLLPLGIRPSSTWPEIHLHPRAEARADAFWQERITGPVLGIHPGSVWATKRWPEEYFAETVRRAVQSGTQVLLFAGPGEEPVLSRIVQLSGLQDSPQLFTFPATLSLPEIAAYIKRLNCYLTNDSGPMHLAWTQRVPTVALFGPTVRSLGFFPRGNSARVFETDLPCRPCGLHGSRKCPQNHHGCMRDITPDMVFPALSRRLEPGRPGPADFHSTSEAP